VTKAELVASLSDQTGMGKEEIVLVINAFTETVRKEMASGNEIYIRGFRSFILKKRATKTARNIKADELIVIPEHYTPQFRPSKDFIEVVKSSKKVLEKMQGSER